MILGPDELVGMPKALMPVLVGIKHGAFAAPQRRELEETAY